MPATDWHQAYAAGDAACGDKWVNGRSFLAFSGGSPFLDLRIAFTPAER
jgi:hypothetical protein